MESLYKGFCEPIIVTLRDVKKLKVRPLVEFISVWGVYLTWQQLDEIMYIYNHNYAIPGDKAHEKDIEYYQELQYVLRELILRVLIAIVSVSDNFLYFQMHLILPFLHQRMLTWL